MATPMVITVLLNLSYLLYFCSVIAMEMIHLALKNCRQIAGIRVYSSNIKMDLQEVGWGAWTGLIWLRIGTGGGLL
jgi:hypothetical protein